MKTLQASRLPNSYFEEIANELQAIANGVGANPKLSVQFAERLHEIAQQMREDAGMTAHSSTFVIH